MSLHSLDLRQLAVELYNRFENYSEVAKQLLVSASWVRSMVLKFKLTGALGNNCSNSGRRPSIDERGRALLTSWLKAENDLILDELLEWLRDEGYNCCRATVANTLTSMGITRKKKRHLPRNRTGRMFGKNGKPGFMR